MSRSEQSKGPQRARSPQGSRRSVVSVTKASLRRVRRVLAWPGLYGWIGIAFAASGLWFLPSGLVLLSRDASLSEEGRRAREAAESARHLGFGEVGPTETTVRTKKGTDEKRWSPPFGFMAPSLRRERHEDGPGKDGSAKDGSRESRPDYVVPDPLAGRALVRAREGAGANARASIVFGVFCLAVSGFWWGFRLLDPATRHTAGNDGSPSDRKAP